MKIVADDKIPFLRGVLEKAGCRVEYLPGGAIQASDVADADALIVRTRTICDATLLANSSVRFVATATIGFDHIDTAYLASRKILWTNAPGCNADSVATYLASVLTHLGTEKKLDLSAATLGVVGVGQVGSRVARLGRALGMRVLENDPPRAEREGGSHWATFEQVKAEADVVSFHVPKIASGGYPTVNLADARFFNGCCRKPWVINTSRGEVVDETALKEALQTGRIAGAVLDVWRGEPGIDLALMGMLYGATPHIAGYSADGKANGTAASVRALSRFFNLGLDDWRPTDVPETENMVLEVPELPERIARADWALRRCYDFLSDDRRLRGEPEKFEALRGNYPLRRDIQAHKIINPGTLAAFWKAIGFQV